MEWNHEQKLLQNTKTQNNKKKRERVNSCNEAKCRWTQSVFRFKLHQFTSTFNQNECHSNSIALNLCSKIIKRWHFHLHSFPFPNRHRRVIGHIAFIHRITIDRPPPCKFKRGKRCSFGFSSHQIRECKFSHFFVLQRLHDGHFPNDPVQRNSSFRCIFDR